jgi:hypothetical protein
VSSDEKTGSDFHCNGLKACLAAWKMMIMMML